MNVTATLFGQMLTFLVLVWFVNRYLWGPMTQMMQARTARIAEGLAAADRSKRELELAEKNAVDKVRAAKQEAADIISAANKRAAEIVEQAKQLAQAEGQRQLEFAQVEIEQEKSRAKEQLREEVLNLALISAEKILQREIKAADHNEFIDKMIKTL